MTSNYIRIQSVKYGKTITGKEGLFTHGTLAWGFNPEGYHSVLDKRKWIDLSLDEQKAWCLSHGFQLEV
jgi:hypothetical protein